MSKITYVDKVALNDNPNVNAINKVRDIDMNEIKEVVNNNETKILLAVVDTAPAQCSTGDMYFNTTSKKIFTATGTDTWGNIGEDPTENTLYVVISTQTTYIYDGDTLVSVGGGTGSSDIIMVDPDTPVQDTKLYIESTDLDFQGLEIANEYTTGNNVAYSADYSNMAFGGTVLYENSSGTTGNITLNDSLANYSKIDILFYQNDAQIYWTETLNEPDGKILWITKQQLDASTSQYYLFDKHYTCSGTSINKSSMTTYFSNSNTYSNYDNFRIKKVIGYK